MSVIFSAERCMCVRVSRTFFQFLSHTLVQRVCIGGCLGVCREDARSLCLGDCKKCRIGF